MRERRRYGGLSADERDAARRGRLLDTGHELFGAVGYPQTSVQQLCHTAGVSTRHFYELYANKESAFLDVYDHINRTSLVRALETLERTEGRPFTRRVPAVVVAYLVPMVEDRRSARIAFVEAVGLSDAVDEHRLRQRSTLVDLVTKEGNAAVRRGEVEPRDFEFATLALAGAANAVIYGWAQQPGGDATQIQHALAELAVRLFAGDPVV